MNGQIIVRGHKGIRHFCQCNCANKCLYKPSAKPIKCEEEIIEYNSFEDARDAGWVCTNHIKFCNPNNDFQWVCPDCAKDFDWDKYTRRLPDNYDRKIIYHQDRRSYGK